MKTIFYYLLLLTISSTCFSADISLDAINTDAINLDNIDTQHEDFTLWIGLFGLAAVGLIGLFLSSEKLSNFKKDSKKAETKKTKLNQKQDQILSDMGKNIQDIAQKNASKTQQLSKDKNNITNAEINRDLADVAASESKLLAITTNLIEFLRIKSQKVEIKNENLKLSNLLNDVAGTLKANTKNIEFNLIYDIKNNIPEDLNGDTLNLSKVLTNLLIYSVENNATKINLKVSKNTIFNKDENLFFTINSNIKIDAENSDNLFNSEYNEDRQNYESLGLFIAKEISSLMGGELIARNDKDKNLEFVFDIPFVRNKESNKFQSSVTGKKVYIVDSSYESALSIKDMLVELKNIPKVERKEKYLLKAPNFLDYDLLIIDEKLFTQKSVDALKNTTAKIISLSNLFQGTKEYPNNDIADMYLNKPLTKIQLDESLKDLFEEKPEEVVVVDAVESTSKSIIKVHRNTFHDTKNISLNTFSEFRDTRVLLVEDNLINQKVMLGVLKKSGMEVIIANHGQEALDIIASSQKFDIIFMDINMPVMDGYTSATKIRENPDNDNTPIVALTALTSPSEISRMFSCGMNGYLAKPLRKEKLFTVFTIFIDNRQTDRRVEERETQEVKALDGLNISSGIAQSNSNEIFYKEILSEFQDAYGDSDKVFKKLVEDFRYEQLKMLCVDIKGLSGSIGAEDMHTLATEVLQRIVYKKYELIPTFIEQYSTQLSRINKSINIYIDDN